MVPSSEDEANKGKVGWYDTDRSAREWYLRHQYRPPTRQMITCLRVLKGLFERSRSNQHNFLS